MPAIKGKKAPRKQCRGLRAKAWWVLRRHKSITMKELRITICNGTEKHAESNLHRWLVKLERAGILVRVRESDGVLTSNGCYRYTLIKDLGPLAPVVQMRTGRVFDPNGGGVIFEGKVDKQRRAEDFQDTDLGGILDPEGGGDG